MAGERVHFVSPCQLSETTHSNVVFHPYKWSTRKVPVTLCIHNVCRIHVIMHPTFTLFSIFYIYFSILSPSTPSCILHTNHSTLHQPNSALANMAPRTAPKLPAAITPRPKLTHQPYTAAFLARLSMFILHAPLAKVRSIFISPLKCDSVPQDIDVNCALPQSDALTSATCQRLLRMLNWPRANASSDTVPLALCLLLRFRFACISCEDVTDDPSDAMRDDVLIAISVHLAYKWLTDGGEVNIQHWAVPLQLNKKHLIEAEREFLGMIGYSVWVKNEEYFAFKGKAEDLWKSFLKKIA